MKKQDGFTLVELLVTIALMLMVLGIAIVSIINISDAKKEESYRLVKDQIITAAEQYFSTNSYYFENLTPDNTIKVSLGRLVADDYLNVTSNPITGKALNKCSYVKVSKKSDKINYEYVENADDIDENGNCDMNSFVTVEPVVNPGSFDLEVIGEKINQDNEWYKYNSKYTPSDNSGEIVVDEQNVSTISKGVVIKLVANSNSGYVINSIQKLDNVINESWLTLWDKSSNSSGSIYDVIAYDLSTYSTTTSENGRSTTYEVVFEDENNPNYTVTKKVNIDNLKVDVDPPTCTAKIIGAKAYNDATNKEQYYCYKPFLFTRVCPSAYFSLQDPGSDSGVGSGINSNYNSYNGKLFSLALEGEADVNERNHFSFDIYDNAGNLSKCKIDEYLFLKENVISSVINNTEVCGKTTGEPASWTNKSSVKITQEFKKLSGIVTQRKEEQFTSEGKTGTIISDNGTKCPVNTYIDKSSPTFKNADVSQVYLTQWDSKGNKLGRRKINVTCTGNSCTGDVCLYNASGRFSIDGMVTYATDNLSGINGNSWKTATTLTNKNGKSVSSCLITSGDNPCTKTFVKYVSDNAGNQGKIATYTFKIGYIRNDKVPNRKYDSFCDQYAPVNNNNYKNYLKD